MTYLLEFWEKKTVVVQAETCSQAAAMVPAGGMFESVRLDGTDYEDRITEYDWCYLCCQPMLGNKNGPIDRWANIKSIPGEDCPSVFVGDEGLCVHETCADSQGREVLSRMRCEDGL